MHNSENIRKIDTYPSAIQIVPDRYKTHEMCYKSVDTCPFVYESVSDRYKTNEICDAVVCKKLKYCLDRYKTQEMCDKAVDACLPALICLLRIKCLKNLINAVFSNGLITS